MVLSNSPNGTSPLSGVRVVDVTHVMAGAYCTMLLGDLGADVVKVENPDGGDVTRDWGVGGGESIAFMALNRNKRGLAVDLADPRGTDLVRRMIMDADVVVENLRPGTMTRFGLGYEELSAAHPGLIYCSISGFGATGPYRDKAGLDLVAQGMSGLMSFTGEPGRPPVKVGVPICDLNAGVFATTGILAAYAHRLRTGEGQFIDTSLLESGIAYTVWESAILTALGGVAEPTGSAHRLSAPYEALRTADGSVIVAAATTALWAKFCRMIARPELENDPRFDRPELRVRNRAELVAILESVLTTRDTAYWVAQMEAAGIPGGPINDIRQVHDDPHVQERQVLIDVEHPTAGPTKQLASPVRLSRTPAVVDRPSPLLGQHSVEVLTELGLDEQTVGNLVDDGIVFDGAHRAEEEGILS